MSKNHENDNADLKKIKNERNLKIKTLKQTRERKSQYPKHPQTHPDIGASNCQTGAPPSSLPVPSPNILVAPERTDRGRSKGIYFKGNFRPTHPSGNSKNERHEKLPQGHIPLSNLFCCLEWVGRSGKPVGARARDKGQGQG